MAGELIKDNWHLEKGTVAERNLIKTRRWGMRVTVYADGGSNGEYVLSPGLVNLNRQDNSNWLLVAAPGATWGGGITVSASPTQIPFVNATGDDFDYSDGLTFIGTTRKLIGGAGCTSATGANSITYGNTNDNGASGSVSFGTNCSITTVSANALTSGQFARVSAAGGKSFGRSTLANGSFSYCGGAWLAGAVDPVTETRTPRTSGFASFAHYASDTSQTNGHGALAPGSAILGALNPNIPGDSDYSVVLGGDLIKADATRPNHVYAQHMNVVDGDLYLGQNARAVTAGTIEVRSSNANADMVFTNKGETGVYQFNFASAAPTVLQFAANAVGELFITNSAALIIRLQNAFQTLSTTVQAGDLVNGDNVVEIGEPALSSQATVRSSGNTVNGVPLYVRGEDGVATDGDGGNLELTGGAADAAGTGGSVIIRSGLSPTGTDGIIDLYSPTYNFRDVDATGTPVLNIRASADDDIYLSMNFANIQGVGVTVLGAGNPIGFLGADTTGTDDGGDVTVRGGNAAGSGDGGDLSLLSGSGGGVDGNITVEAGGGQLSLNAVAGIRLEAVGTKLNIQDSTANGDPSFGRATLVAGTVTVNTTAVTANSNILLTSQVDGGTPGFLRVSARVANTSFTITSSDGADTSTIAWWILEPI